MRFPPPIVAQAATLFAHSEKLDSLVSPLGVGLVPWPEKAERTTIVVKFAYTFDPRRPTSSAQLAAEHPPLVFESLPSTRQGARDGELEAAPDMVRAKTAADIMVVGSAFAETPTETVQARVRIPQRFERSFAVVGAARKRHPLAGGYLREADGVSPTQPVGPVLARPVIRPPSPPAPNVDPAVTAADDLAARIKDGSFDPTRGDNSEITPNSPPEESPPLDVSAEDIEWMWQDLVEQDSPFVERGTHHAARASMANEFLYGNEILELDGLVPGGSRRALELPGFEPQVIVETDDQARLWPVMICDTLVLDTDLNTITLTWRGQVTQDLLATPMVRLVVGLRPSGANGLLSQLYRDLQRGHFSRAEVMGGAPDPCGPDGRDLELELARAATFDMTPDPSLSMEEYSRVAAALGTGDDRDVVLGNFSLDQDSWMLEERGWMDRIARAMSRGDHELPMQMDAMMSKARQALE